MTYRTIIIIIDISNEIRGDNMIYLENPRIQLRLGRIPMRIRYKTYQILRDSLTMRKEQLSMLLISEAKKLQKEMILKAEKSRFSQNKNARI